MTKRNGHKIAKHFYQESMKADYCVSIHSIYEGFEVFLFV